MSTYITAESVLAFIVVAPGVVFFAFALAWLLGTRLREATVGIFTAAAFTLITAAAMGLGVHMAWTGQSVIRNDNGAWFEVGNYHFPMVLTADWLSLPLIILTTVLLGLIGIFSRRYLHREPGFIRFFLLLQLFAFGMLLLFAAGSIDLLIGGWELVGITSALLIAFFHERSGPVNSAIQVFSMYRIGDLGLLLGVFIVYATFETSEFSGFLQGSWPTQTTAFSGSGALLTSLLFLLAAAAKSAQLPFSGWLPRAMEGPTPSSAIFYGALSIHAGAYLLLRIQPVLAASPWGAAAVIVLGGLSALLGTLAQRVATDAKSSIAYAALSQLGIIFIEIGLGFPRLALAHMLGHAVVRTVQFLRAPSMLHDHHRLHAAAGGHLGVTGAHYTRVLSPELQVWLYRVALDRCFYDSAADRFVIQPVLAVSRWMLRREPHHAKSRLQPPPAPPMVTDSDTSPAGQGI